MVRCSIKSVFNDLNKEVGRCISLVNVVDRLPASKLTKSNKERITELAFLKIYAAWECFLENTFLRYMVGAKTLKNFQPKKYVSPPTIEKALNIVAHSIAPRGSRRPSNWKGEAVMSRAPIYFKDGEPFNTGMRIVAPSLNAISDIRNAIAHTSVHSEKKFKDLIQNELPTHTGIISPGKFLLTDRPRIIPRETFFIYYSDMIKIAAKEIAEYKS